MGNNGPALIIMAAGLGSRYGGLKQIEPVDKYGHIIMDFSIYDAVNAGFSKVIFVIKKENEEVFKEVIGNRIEKKIPVEYVFQELENIPEGYSVPEGRVKPWGTGHAVMSCADFVDGPFAVINADDYYGSAAFSIVHDYLVNNQDDDKYRYTMAGFILGNTLTENGHVARGVCRVDQGGNLLDITERTHIEKRDGCAVFTEDGGETWDELPFESIVSMNMWGFQKSMMKELKERFAAFLAAALEENPLSAEYFLPSVVSELLNEGKASVSVKMTPDKWYGVTYKEDREMLLAAIERLEKSGRYPEDF